MILHVIEEQLKAWASLIREGRLAGVPEGLEEVAQSLQGTGEYQREGKLGDEELEQALIEEARELYAHGSDDNIEIDEGAQFSDVEDGTWVQAWVWVPKKDEEETENG